MKYFVTGATGFIGRHVARQLHDQGHEVITVARKPDKTRNQVDTGVEVFKGDITDKESLREPMTGVDGVFHIAAWYKLGVADKKETETAERTNVDGTRNVLEMMKELKIKKGVYTSTLAVFSDTHGKLVNENYRHKGPWLTEYDRTKWKAHYEVAEPMMRDGRLPLVIVMPGLVYGPGDASLVHETLVAYLKRRLPMVPRQTAFCWGHIEDTARAHILAMEQGKIGETYIMAGPMHTLVGALEIAQSITGIKPPRFHPKPGLIRLLANLMSVPGAIQPLARRLPESYTKEALRAIAGVTYIANSEKAKRELGYQFRSLEEGLRETIAFEQRTLR